MSLNKHLDVSNCPCSIRGDGGRQLRSEAAVIDTNSSQNNERTESNGVSNVYTNSTGSHLPFSAEFTKHLCDHRKSVEAYTRLGIGAPGLTRTKNVLL